MDPVKLLKTDVAEGKTSLAMQLIVEHLKEGRNVVFAAPNHELLGDVYQRLKTAMETAGFKHNDIAVWHGVSRENMCLRPDDLNAVIDAGFPVKSTLCQINLSDDDGAFAGVQYLCRHAKFGGVRCGMTEQRQKHPKVWLVPHASLFDHRDALFDGDGGINTLIIDESITNTAMPSYDDHAAKLKKSELTKLGDAPQHVLSTWEDIAESLEKHMKGLFEQYNACLLPNAGIDDAIAWHQEKLKECGVFVGLSGDQLKAELTRASDCKVHKSRLVILREIKRLNLGGDKRALWVETRSDGEKLLKFCKLKTIHPSWIDGATTVIAMDATPLDDLLMLAQIFGRHVKLTDGGRKVNPLSPIVHTTIIKKAPISKGRRENQKNIAHMRGFLNQICASHGGQNMCVMKAGYSIYDANNPQPENLDVTSSGYAMGSNKWEKADTIIWFGPHDAGPRTFEYQASLFGRLTKTLPDPKKGRVWWPQEVGSMPMRNGDKVQGEVVTHPCEAVLTLRNHSQHGRIYQAVGRGRALRRDESCPLHIFVCTAEDVGLQADTVVEWHDIVREVTISEKLKTTGIFINPAHHCLLERSHVDATEDEYRRLGLSGYTLRGIPYIY